MRKNITFIILFFTALLAGCSVKNNNVKDQAKQDVQHKTLSSVLKVSFNTWEKTDSLSWKVVNTRQEKLSKNEDKTEFKVIISPHYMINPQMVDNLYQKVKDFHPENIVLISPNHFWKWSKNFESVSVDTDTICWKGNCIRWRTLYKKWIVWKWDWIANWTKEDDVCFSISWWKCNLIDHGLWEHFHFIKKYFPKTITYPLLVRNYFFNDKKLVNYLKNRFKNTKTLFIFSVDMSHYNLENWAYLHDRNTIYTLNNSKNVEDYKNLEVDCPECLYIAKHFSTWFQLLQRDSASLKFGAKDTNTSIMTFIWTWKLNENGLTLAFFWDVIYDRWIKYYFPTKEKYYHFLREFFMKNNEKNDLKRKWNRKLVWLDFAWFNLETPVVDNKNLCQKTNKIVAFCSDNKFLGWLKALWFNFVSLANNHSMDGWILAHKNTIENLEKVGFKYTGYIRYWKYFEKNYVFTGVKRWIKYVFLWFDFTISNTSLKKAENIIKKYKKQWYLVFTIVHWWSEFQLKHNKYQEAIAKKLVDAGSNIILWSHPHVVQDIWYYKNVPIVYSVWNFIFDQFKIKNWNIWWYVLLDIDKSWKINSLNLWKFAIKISWISFK